MVSKRAAFKMWPRKERRWIIMREIILYTKPGCPKCAVLRKKLNTQNVFYKEISSIEEMIAMGFKSAPVLVVDGEKMDYLEAIKWVNSYKEGT